MHKIVDDVLTFDSNQQEHIDHLQQHAVTSCYDATKKKESP